MATYFARKAGNINASDVWATTPSGIAAAVTFASGDVLVANSFTITINVSTDLGATGEVRNDNTASATAGGSFTLADGVTLTANIFAGSTGTACVSQTGTASGVIVGNARGGTSVNGGHGISKSSTGTLTLTGNITGGTTALQHGVSISAGTTNFTGNIVGGNSGGGGVPASSGFVVSGGTLNVLSGTVTGGTVNSVYGLYVSGGSVTYNGTVTGPTQITSTTAHAIFHAAINTLTINGSVTGGAGGCGVANSVGGTVAINGTVAGGSLQPGCLNSSTGVITATRVVGNAYGPGNTSGLAAVVGASNAGLGVIQIQELEFGTFGMSPTSGTGIRLKKASSNVAVFNYCDTAGAKTLIDATQNAAMPAASNVRSGVSYASGALTGTCAVPSAGSVGFGVPVDATTGTAVLTPEAVWGAATRTLTAGAGISASDVWAYNSRTLTTSSGPTAVEIRQEIDANSTKLDATVSSRLASSAYTAPTTPPTAAQIATAVEGSLLNEADGQQVLNAIVGAIGNTNLSEVSLVAAIRTDIERAGGKLDSVPTAAANASAVWGTATKQITGGTVDTLTNSPSVPSAASIAAATRTELAVELARVDASVSSRMAASESSKLDAVKAKTDALNTERLANVATTAIVGNLIAQANS
jgi:hypothetical protein